MGKPGKAPPQAGADQGQTIAILDVGGVNGEC